MVETSPAQSLLNDLPILALTVQQIDEEEVVFYVPIAFCDAGAEIVVVVLFNLASVAVLIGK